MAANANVAPHERLYGVTNIKTHIPFVLDSDDGNYDAWRELFMTHCQSFDVAGHLDGTNLPADAADEAWTKRDGVVKLWIYGTLSKDLLRSTYKTGGTSREIWTRLETYFRDNKEARAVQLDHKLRTRELGDLSIQAYCQELKTIADLLSNIDSPVSERTLVTYLLNGLNAKYDNIINVIIHRQPFPTFEQARSMLLMEEDRLGKSLKTSKHKDESSSSAKALNVSTTQSEQKPAYAPNQNFRGRGNRGRNRGRGRYNNHQRPSFNSWGAPFWQPGYPMWPQHNYGQWRQSPQQPSPQ